MARRLLICLAAMPFCLAAFTVPARAADSKPSVVVITIDTLRADHLGCYGDGQIQTPHIDALARVSARFAHAYTPVPITLPAHTVLFTGSYPMATGIHDFSGNKLAPSAVTLAKVLRAKGYTTAAFLGSAVLDSRFGLNQGFDTYFDHFDFSRLDEANLELMERPGDQVMDAALDWLRANPRRPFFLWVHLYDPHHPYTPPEPYASRYKTHPYDGEIAFDDAQVGRLVSFLKDAGVFSNAVMVLVGDHGEGLGEHGEKTHGFFVYNSTLHIPLLIKVPGAGARVIGKEVSLVDVMPTVLQALKVPIPATVQGRSLLSEVLGKPTSTASHILAENYLPLLHFRWSQLLALQYGKWKYIDAPRPELYDIQTDPKESKNLYKERQAIGHEMHDRLFDLMRRYTPASGSASKDKEPTDPALAERLRSLGYVAVSAGTYTEASGKKLPDPKDRIQVYEWVSDANSNTQQGHYHEALSALRKAEKVEANSVTIRYLTALNYYHLKDYPRAVEAFERVLKLDPRFSLATYYTGLCRLGTGDLNGAADSFQRTLEMDSTNFTAAYNLGAVYTRQKRVDDAVQAFELAVKILPDYADAHEALGELYLYQKQLDKAVRELEKAVKIAPGMRKAHYNLGRAYAAKGLTEQAQREFQLAGKD